MRAARRDDTRPVEHLVIIAGVVALVAAALTRSAAATVR